MPKLFSAFSLVAARRPRSSPIGLLATLTLALALAAVLTGCGVSASAGGSEVNEGKKLYKAECATCHGENGSRIPASPLDSAEFLNSRGDASLMAVIGEGKGVMPAFGKEKGGPFTDDQIRFVLAFLSSEAGRSSSSLLAQEGRQVFEGNCSKCHGTKGERIPAAPLNAKGFLDGKTDAELVRVISEGKGLMPAWAKNKGGALSDPQIRSVVGYLRYNVDADMAQRARQGRELYVGNCLACHGERGDRVPNVTLAAADYLTKLGDGSLISSITEGKGVMPGFGRTKGGPFGIPDTAALLAYLKSWAGLRATSALTGPEQVGTGRDLFARNCTPCHGESGDKVAGVQLKSQDFLRFKTDRVVKTTIMSGNAKGMPAWSQANGGPFNDEQIDSIIQYLKSVAQPGTAQAGVPASASGSGSGPAPAAPATTSGSAGGAYDPGLVSKGKDIFSKNCAGCHGPNRDQIPTCKLADKDWLNQKGEDGLIQAITNGKPPMMPTWGKAKGGSLGDDEIKAAAAYLRDAAGLKSGGGGGSALAPTSGSAPAASSGGAAGGPYDAALVSKGKDLYSKTCVGCHGPNRDQVPTCKLADKAWLESKGEDGLIQAITNGKPPMMPTWGKAKGGSLGDDEIKAAAAYIRDAAGLAPGGGGGGGGAPSASSAPAPVPVSAVIADPFGDDNLVPTIALGKQIYEAKCMMCHGKDGMGQGPCRLGSKEWLQNMSEEGLRGRITGGKPGAGMPTWGKSRGGPLSDKAISAVMMYLYDGIKS